MLRSYSQRVHSSEQSCFGLTMSFGAGLSRSLEEKRAPGSGRGAPAGCCGSTTTPMTIML